MDKKISFKDQPTRAKIIYVAVVAVLTVTAIVVGIVSAASNKEDTPPVENNPPIIEGEGEGNGEGATEPEKVTYVMPVVGEVAKSHSLDVPVFSTTLGDFRIHTGVDISAEEGAAVVSAADGTVTRVYNDHFLGKTVEISHTGGVVTQYSNLDAESVEVSVGDTVKCGEKIGTVGDTSLTELADEAHLHFEMKVDGASVDPLEYVGAK
jgi:murein DD-endopeptidase MepM/ murein hydrolase activator NlpD